VRSLAPRDPKQAFRFPSRPSRAPPEPTPGCHVAPLGIRGTLPQSPVKKPVVRLFDEIQDKSRQLQQASENKSAFVSSMSHELRTPLNAIIGLTEMMVKNAARFGTEKAQEPLQRVNRAGTHLLGLINQVLDLSKIEAGKLELNPKTVQLAPLIKDVIDTAGQLAEQNKNRLVIDAQENLGALTVALVPGVARVAVLVNPASTTETESTVRDVESAAHAIGLQIQVFTASTSGEIDEAFATFVRKRCDGLLTGPSPFFTARRFQLTHLATRHAIPAIYTGRQYTEVGGLMSYGASLTDAYRQMGVYAGHILKGTKPTDLPVVQSSKLELVINAQAARTLGLTVPDKLLVAADEVIE